MNIMAFPLLELSVEHVVRGNMVISSDEREVSFVFGDGGKIDFYNIYVFIN